MNKFLIIFASVLLFLSTACVNVLAAEEPLSDQTVSQRMKMDAIEQALDEVEDRSILEEPLPDLSKETDAGEDVYGDEEVYNDAKAYSDTDANSEEVISSAPTIDINEETDRPDIARTEIVKKELDWLECQFNMNSGLRWDYLRWNIAGDINGQNPNILSELTWDNLWSAEIEAKGNVILGKFLRLEGSAGYGWIFSGENQDSDYLADDRQLEFSRSNNVSDGDNVLDASAGVGLQFHIGDLEGWEEILTDDLWVTVLGGYSYHEQNLRMTDGSQTIPATGAFGGLDSTYQAEWDGPWAGIEFTGSRDKWKGFSRFEYHWADYYAEADWNLRSDFQHPVSYTHTADGWGVVVSFGGEYQITESWTAGLEGDLNFWETDPGVDRTYFASGAVVDTQLNEVVWRSYGLSFSTTYRF